MRKLFTISFIFFALHLLAQDTFSIIAVDPATGEVGAAGASCVDGAANFGGVILLNKIIPGKGGVNAQAWICINPHINLDNAIEQMDNGLSPDEIITWLQNNDQCQAQEFNPAYRQYGVVDLDENGMPRAAAFTGQSADDYKGHRVGENYAIQGNILLGPAILDSMEQRFLNAEGTLANRLMEAMQGANVPGADARCLARGTSSTSAFLRVFRPSDALDDPYLEINIPEVPLGEEPIDSLQILYEWSLISGNTNDLSNPSKIKVFPNPSNGEVQFLLQDYKPSDLYQIHLYNLKGELLHQEIIERSNSRFPSRLFGGNKWVVYQIRDKEGVLVQTGKIVLE